MVYQFKGQKLANRLLILGCSKKKNPAPGEIPVLERYKGPIFGVVNKYLRKNPEQAQSLDIYILSARFGLIAAETEIPNYDQKINPEQAQALNPQVIQNLEDILYNGRAYQKLFVNLGQAYWPALTGYENLLPNNITLKIAIGSQGKRQVDLRAWLYGDMLNEQISPYTSLPGKKVRLRGVEIALTPKQIIEIASEALLKDDKGADNYQSWYVSIGDKQVAPKWLVSQLTGFAVGNFHSGEARRVLQQLGVEVKKV